MCISLKFKINKIENAIPKILESKFLIIKKLHTHLIINTNNIIFYIF